MLTLCTPACDEKSEGIIVLYIGYIGGQIVRVATVWKITPMGVC
jgi:hypothetical protein